MLLLHPSAFIYHSSSFIFILHPPLFIRQSSSSLFRFHPSSLIIFSSHFIHHSSFFMLHSLLFISHPSFSPFITSFFNFPYPSLFILHSSFVSLHRRCSDFILHPYSFSLHFVHHSSFFILHSLFFIFHLSSFILCPPSRKGAHKMAKILRFEWGLPCMYSKPFDQPNKWTVPPPLHPSSLLWLMYWFCDGATWIPGGLLDGTFLGMMCCNIVKNIDDSTAFHNRLQHRWLAL